MWLLIRLVSWLQKNCVLLNMDVEEKKVTLFSFASSILKQKRFCTLSNREIILLYSKHHWVFGLHHSSVYQIRVVLTPLIWFISEKNMLYSERIYVYEAYKSLRTVTSSRLMLYKGLLFGRSWILGCLLHRYRLQITAISWIDKFTWYLSSLIFNWFFHSYDNYYLEIIYS